MDVWGAFQPEVTTSIGMGLARAWKCRKWQRMHAGWCIRLGVASAGVGKANKRQLLTALYVIQRAFEIGNSIILTSQEKTEAEGESLGSRRTHRR